MPASTSANRLLETSDASSHSCHSCFVTRHRRLLDVSGPMGCAATRKGRGEAYCDGGDEAGGNWCGRSGDHEGPMAWLGALVDRYGWTKISGRTSTKMHQVLLCGQPWIAFPQSMLKCRIHVELGRGKCQRTAQKTCKRSTWKGSARYQLLASCYCVATNLLQCDTDDSWALKFYVFPHNTWDFRRLNVHL